MLRAPLVGNADFLISSVLRIAHHTTVAYVLRLLLVFALSGAVHVGLDLGFALSFSQTGAMRFFVLQAFGMLFEQAVWSVLRHVGCERRSGKAGRVVGYFWVAGFLVLAAPTWVVPIIRSLYESGERVLGSFLLDWGWLLV